VSRWPRVPLGGLVSQVARTEAVKPDGEYRLLGVRLEGNGAFHRETVRGTETSASRLSKVETGDFIYSRLFAWRGAFGLIGSDLGGSFVSNEFPLFRVDEARLDARYLNRWFQLPATWLRVEEDCTGSTPTTRNRFKEEFFLKLELPLPPLAEQQAIVARLDALADKTRQLTAHLDAIEADADQLLAQQFQAAIAGAPYRPMSEVAPLVRREVAIDPDTSYTELGVRSFYKGTFHRRTVAGSEFTWQKMFRIEADDLIFSNIMAWEQAIALARPEDHGCVGNHRMLTCLADRKQVLPAFLAYYFTTEKGFAKVYAASPGTAARNRTLVAGNLEAIEVPVPPLAAQQAFTSLQSKLSALRERHVAIREANVALQPAALERLFSAPGRTG